ncbi:hypothetical protein [Nocardioides sp.]|uniref:hypothetical protein n=1 Tax=Nocardioides sp. TaxID=35761 RepID=UPI003783395D
MDLRLRTAVASSVAWYDDAFAALGIPVARRGDLWVAGGLHLLIDATWLHRPGSTGVMPAGWRIVADAPWSAAGPSDAERHHDRGDSCSDVMTSRLGLADVPTGVDAQDPVGQVDLAQVEGVQRGLLLGGVHPA